jgi:hypothetical protein
MHWCAETAQPCALRAELQQSLGENYSTSCSMCAEWSAKCAASAARARAPSGSTTCSACGLRACRACSMLRSTERAARKGKCVARFRCCAAISAASARELLTVPLPRACCMLRESRYATAVVCDRSNWRAARTHATRWPQHGGSERRDFSLCFRAALALAILRVLILFFITERMYK